MSTVQSKVEELLYKPIGTVIHKASDLGLPKIADSMVDKITLKAAGESGSSFMIEVDLSWAGRQSVRLGGATLKNNPINAQVSRAIGGGLLIKSSDLDYADKPIELTLVGDTYKIKGKIGTYTFQ